MSEFEFFSARVDTAAEPRPLLPSPLAGEGTARMPFGIRGLHVKNGQRGALAYPEAKPSEGGRGVIALLRFRDPSLGARSANATARATLSLKGRGEARAWQRRNPNCNSE
jgi:hypothetical protein